MKTPFKNILPVLGFMLAASAGLIPHASSAADLPSPKPVNTALVAALANQDTLGFCGALSAYKGKTLAQISSVAAAIGADKDSSKLLLAQRQAGKDAQITAARTAEDQTMQSVFASLEAQAQTNSQKAAVKEFEKAASDATAVRRQRVDDALSGYRTGLKSTLDLQNSQIDAAVAAYQSAMQKSLSDADANCASGIASATLEASLKANLGAAKSSLLDDEKTVAAAGPKIDALLSVRRKAIVSADQDFHGALNAARNALKPSFPN